MKKVTIFAALIALAVSSSFAAEKEKEIVTLPAQVLHYGNAIPTVIERTVPEIPASIAGLDGFVLLQFDITEGGRVANIEVVKSSNAKIAKYSKAMVRRWAFNNAGGMVTAQQPIVFEADSKAPTLLALR